MQAQAVSAKIDPLPMLWGPDQVPWDIFYEAFVALCKIAYPRGGRMGALGLALPAAEFRHEFHHDFHRYAAPASLSTNTEGDRKEARFLAQETGESIVLGALLKAIPDSTLRKIPGWTPRHKSANVSLEAAFCKVREIHGKPSPAELDKAELNMKRPLGPTEDIHDFMARFQAALDVWARAGDEQKLPTLMTTRWCINALGGEHDPRFGHTIRSFIDEAARLRDPKFFSFEDVAIGQQEPEFEGLASRILAVADLPAPQPSLPNAYTANAAAATTRPPPAPRVQGDRRARQDAAHGGRNSRGRGGGRAPGGRGGRRPRQDALHHCHFHGMNDSHESGNCDAKHLWPPRLLALPE